MNRPYLPCRIFAVAQGHDAVTQNIRTYRITRARCDYWTARLLAKLPTVAP